MVCRRLVAGFHRSLFSLLSFLVLGCNGDEVPSDEVRFRIVASHERAAFMAVHGTAANDLWAVGADDGKGPVVLHFSGTEWERKDTGFIGDLWWVQALGDGTTFFAGTDSHILEYDGETFSRLPVPGLGAYIVFGVWAHSKNNLYAVGSVSGRNGFIWHYDGSGFESIPLPDELIRPDGDVPALFKVSGHDPDDVWIVGGEGTVLRGNATDGFRVVPSDTEARLFTVHVDEDEVLIAGGAQEGVVRWGRLGDEPFTLMDRTPPGAPLLQGAFVHDRYDWLSGRAGELYFRSENEFEAVPLELDRDVQSLHSVWVDPEGGVWAVGGNVITGSLDQGVVLHGNSSIVAWEAPPVDPDIAAACPKDLIDIAPDRSMARRFNEQMLQAIRRDLPRPTVHARNLLHTSLAMWDAWAAYDDTAQGVIVNEQMTSADIDAARDEAIAYASYRVLSHRYSGAVGGAISQSCFDDFMDVLGFDPEDTSTIGDSPRALGNRIGEAIIERFRDDGSNEENDYADPDGFVPEQPLLIVAEPGVTTNDPTQWQQLLLAEAVTQNGIAEGSGVRDYVGAHWGGVVPFALVRPGEGEPYFRLENPPTALDDALVSAAVEIVRKTSELDIDDGAVMDISPAGYGNNPLGTNDGTGYAQNPVTGEPYEEEVVLRGDFTRVLAEFWADGPKSETPPGHWNTLANYVADHPETTHRLFGAGEPLDALSWDVHVYLALNGAVHDAAIAAWEQKRLFTSARPITLIRYLCGKGQRSDPDMPAYHPEGIPLEDDLIEVITTESSAPAGRHEHLARYVGEIAVRSWRGEPGDRKTEIGGIDWIRCADWVAYQRRTFVTPAFPGYVSGHSTFSRAAAEALTLLTGDAYFPGGLGAYEIEPGYLVFEFGPSQPITLKWATYYDAADQAGQSRLWGGIHVRHDDFDGRRIGSVVGVDAVNLARTYFGSD